MTVKKGEALFPRIDVEKEIEELNAIIKNNEKVDEKTEKLKEEIEGVAQIGIDDFCKVDLRVAEIKACEPIKKAKKLLKLTIFDGVKERPLLRVSQNSIHLTTLSEERLFLYQTSSLQSSAVLKAAE